MSKFVNAMRFVGDLDDEFYDDELQRDVWNEASAVGLQLFVWASLIAASILPWAFGAVGGWATLAIIVAFLVISIVVQLYAKELGVDMQTSQNLMRPRMFLTGGLYFFAAVSAVIVLLSAHGGFRVPFAWGMAAGVPIGLACGVYGIARRRRLQREDERHAEYMERLELDGQ